MASHPRMRILILSQYFWPESFRINSFAEALLRAGAEVTVLTGQPNYPDGAIFEGYAASSFGHEFMGGIEVLRVPLAPRGNASGLRLALNYLSFVASASLFGPWRLRDRKVDVILVYAPSPILQAIPAILIGRIKSARVVTWVQDLWPESLTSTGHVRNARILSAVDAVVRWIYRRNDLLLGQSQAFVAAIREKAGSTPVSYFPNPADDPLSNAIGERAALSFPSGFNVVFAGNLGTVQSLDTIVGAAELLKNRVGVRITLVGSGSRSEWLTNEVSRRGLSNLVIAGRYPSADMPGILAQASALLVCLGRSDTLSKTIPSKLQSYFAAGRPLVGALDGEGADLIMRSGAGIAVPAEDATALADAIARLSDYTPAELARLADAAHTFYVAHFEPDTLAKRLLTTLAELE